MSENKSNIYSDINNRNSSATCCIVDGHVFTYDDFHQMVDRVAAHLVMHGVRPGDRIGIQDLSDFEFLVACYGSAKVGATAVPIPFKQQDKIAQAQDSAKITYVLNFFPDKVDQLSPVDTQHSDEAMVIYTSGTTSQALKGVRLSHFGISSTAKFMNQRMKVDANIRELVFAPLDHAYGFGRCHAILCAGGSLVLPSSIDNWLALFGLLKRNHCNALSTMPSILISAMNVASNEIEAIGGMLLWLQTGAMRFNQPLRQSLIESLPNTRIFFHYGLSEAMRTTFIDLSSEQHKLHTEGRPADGVEIQILDPEKLPLPPNREGTIAIRGNNLCLGYLDQSNWEENCDQGWFITSDRGYIDEQGYLVFQGRDDDVININGYLVHPDEIETHLTPLIPANNFAIVGVPDPNGIRDTIAALIIEGDSDISLSDIKNHLIKFKDIPAPNILMNCPALPRTRSGKIIRRELEQLVSNRINDRTNSLPPAG